MKFILYILIVFTILGCSKEVKVDTISTVQYYSFQKVWDEVSSNPLKELPKNSISFNKLSSSTENLILKDAKRTLISYADILEPFDKLAHPNGICFKGIWNIDTENIYSGYFKKGSRSLIISRASTALSDTTNDSQRAFGFAGKLFATTNPNKVNKFHTANFFLIDDLGGTKAKSYTSVTLTNEPSVSLTFAVFKNLLYASKVAYNFAQADKNSGIRQLYEISQLGEKSLKDIITPKWMKIETENDSKREVEDFRDELKIDVKKLIFTIYVANKIENNHKNWQKIGTITLDTSIVSNSCDHRLHFHHPKYRDDLNHEMKMH